MMNLKFILISFCFCFCFSQTDRDNSVDGVLAVVGENIITQSEFFEQLQIVSNRQGITSSSTPLKYESLAKNLLSNIVNQLVLLEHAKMDTNIFIGDDEVKKQLDLQISGFINSMGSVEALENYLNKSLREIKAFYWDEIYNAMLIERFRYSLLSGISVGKKEVDDFYITYKDSLPPVPRRASFSLLNMKFVPSEKTVKNYYNTTKSILDELNNKQTTFENLIKQHSDDFASIPNSGIVGETERGSFLKEYEEAAFSAKIGSIVGPIKTSAGFHIIKVLDKKGEKITTQHLLKTIQPSLEDKDSLVSLINNIYSNSKLDSSFLYNLLVGGDYLFGLSGNYTNYYYENLPQEVVKMIDSSQKKSLVSPFGFSDGTLGLLYVYDKQKSETATLDNSYDYIAGLAKEKKSAEFVEKWLMSAKKEVYINIFSEN